MNLAFYFEAGPRSSKFSKVVEDALQARRDDATLRLARIANMADPTHKNGSCRAKRCRKSGVAKKFSSRPLD